MKCSGQLINLLNLHQLLLILDEHLVLFFHLINKTNYNDQHHQEHHHFRLFIIVLANAIVMNNLALNASLHQVFITYFCLWNVSFLFLLLILYLLVYRLYSLSLIFFFLVSAAVLMFFVYFFFSSFQPTFITWTRIFIRPFRWVAFFFLKFFFVVVVVVLFNLRPQQRKMKVQ